jgi:hypothetical protein
LAMSKACVFVLGVNYPGETKERSIQALAHPAQRIGSHDNTTRQRR